MMSLACGVLLPSLLQPDRAKVGKQPAFPMDLRLALGECILHAFQHQLMKTQCGTSGAALNSAIHCCVPAHCADRNFLPDAVRGEYVDALDEFYLARTPMLSARPELDVTPHGSANSEAAAKAAERNRKQAKSKLMADQKLAKARAQKASAHKFALSWA